MSMPTNNTRCLATAFIAGLALTAGVGCGELDDSPDTTDFATRSAALPASFCEVNVVGKGMINVEDEYIAGVVACENGNAPPEALKAQAIAARTYAAFMMQENGSILDSQGGQVFSCGRAPGPEHIEAARSTSGQVLTHNGELIASFYVSGVMPSTTTCVPTARDRTNASSTDARVERYVTYNPGRTGSSVQPSPLGHLQNIHNRGCMSQNGSSCLANQGRSASSIFRYYYGDDVRVTQLGGSCVDEVPGTPEPPPNDDGGNGSGTSDPPGEDGGATCNTAAQGVTIVPRSGWGAAAPKYLRAPHTPNKITIHHTVQPTTIDGARAVRSAQRYHQVNRGWADIGYHFLIARDGTIYEGTAEGRQGAHVANQNSGNLGISLIGSFSSEQPQDAQLRAAAALIRHLSDKYNITINRNNHKGHGERMSTDCPGRNVDLDALIAMAQADATCDEPEPEPELELPDIDLADNASYPFVRLKGLSGETVVDSIYYARGTTNVSASSVVSSTGVTNASAATGEFDVEECGSVGSNAAVIGSGGELVVEFDDPIQGGESVAIVSSASGADSCNRQGRVEFAVSVDGEEWIVVNESTPTDTTARPPSGDIEFITPEGETTPVDTSFSAEASQTIVRVEYYAEKYKLGTSEDAGSKFPVDYSFSRTGQRLLSVWGYDSSGQAIAMAQRLVTVQPDAATFQFSSPRAGQVYRPEMSFTVATGNPDIVKVAYQRGDGSLLANISTSAGGFPFGITLDSYGERSFIAVGYDSSNQEVARDTVTVTISTQGGTVPPGSGDPPGTGEVPPTNTSAAEALATASFNYGNGKRSGGMCWKGVKTAALRANTSEGYNWPALQSQGPCSSYNFALSAYCFKRQADANPNTLRSRYGMQKINVDPRNAPRGAIIAYDRGCNGYNSTHGHIEVAQGNGRACSDYCGNIKAGSASCASVYTHVQ